MAQGVAIRVSNAPDELAGSATTVEITEQMGAPTYYRLDYVLDIQEGDFPLLKEAKLGPGSELSVFVAPGGESECLVKGPVCGQQIRMEHGGSGSTLTVQGADSSVKLDRE